jgi:hypothetical protein
MEMYAPRRGVLASGSRSIGFAGRLTRSVFCAIMAVQIARGDFSDLEVPEILTACQEVRS